MNNFSPCWFVTDTERLNKQRTNQPYTGYQASEYFKLVNRIDHVFIEGYIGRKDREGFFLNNVLDRLNYLIDFQERKKVYFTFDRINLYQLVEFFPNYPAPIRFILKRLNHRNFKATSFS